VWGAIGHHGMGSRHGACAPKRKNKSGVPGHAGNVCRRKPLSVKGMSETLTARRWHRCLARGELTRNCRRALPRCECGRRHRDEEGFALHAQTMLLIEWPVDQAQPTSIGCRRCVIPRLWSWSRQPKWRRIERDYQELKQEFAWSHYEDGCVVSYHATLCIAA